MSADILKHRPLNVELAQKQRNVSLLEQKNAQFVEELVEQQKTITKIKRQLEDKEKHCASYLHKIDVVSVRVQDLKAALQKKEEVIRTQRKYCQELKGLVWKRDAMIGQLQLAEQQLQSALARQEAAYEALECLKEKLHEEKILVEKNLVQVQEKNAHLDSGALHKECERLLQDKEVFLRAQRRQIHDLQKTLQCTAVLSSKHKDQQHLLEENRRVVDRYESLRHDFEQAQRKQQQLETDLAVVQERLSTAEIVIAEAEQSATVENTQFATSSDGSITEEQAADNGVDEIDAEGQCMASFGSTAMKMVSRAEIIRRSKLRSSQKSLPVEASCALLFSARDGFSARRGQRTGSNMQSLRSPPAEGVNHSSIADCSKQLPCSTNHCESTQVARNFYLSCPETAKRCERMGERVARIVDTHSYPSRTNFPFNTAAEARTCLASDSSQQSSPCAKVSLNYSSDIDQIDREETVQRWCLAERTKDPSTSICNSRKKTSSLPQGSPFFIEDSRSLLFSPTDQTINSLFSENKSSSKTHRKLISRGLEAFQTSRPAGPLTSTEGLKIVPKLLIPARPEQSEVSGSSSVEFERSTYPSEPKAGPILCQGNLSLAKELSRPLSGVCVKKTVERIPPRGPKHQLALSPKARELLKPPNPAPTNIQGSGDAALKSLQEEVMKRERGWRRTEANMRAVLCQRLTELRDTKKIGPEVMEPRRGETRQNLQQRKT